MILAPAGARGDDKTDAKVRQLQAELDKATLEWQKFEKKLERLHQEIAEEKLKIERMLAERAGLSVEDWREASPDRKNTIPLPLAPLSKGPPRLFPNLRAEVVDADGDLVTLSVGIDGGLEVGTVLDIYRIEGGPRYLGTVKITNRLNLMPKSAVVTFTPARKVPFDKLRPEELPKKGDEVRPHNALVRDR